MSTPGKPRCTATSKRTGKQCQRDATPGMSVCYYHGSATGASKRAATRRLALGAAEVALDEERRLGRVLPVEPAEAMLEMVREAAGNVAVLRHLVETLTVETVDAPQPETVTVGAVEDEDGEEQGGIEIVTTGRMSAAIAGLTGSTTKWNDAAPHVWVVMYNDERERLVKWAKACRDAGVDERRVELAEGQARMMAGLIRGVADRLLAALLGLEWDGEARKRIEGVWRDTLPVAARAELEAIRTTEVPA